jgi:peptidoglycan glycosyltransferase
MKNKTFRQQIMGVTWFFVALFIAMSCYICFYAIYYEKEMANNPFNGLQFTLMEQNTRGRIFAAGGEVLAESRRGSDGADVRYYPYGNLFAHVVGFDTHGRAGIEADANYYLIRSNIPLTYKLQNGVNGVKNGGNSVYTTLRLDLQEVAARTLANTGFDGAIIVSEPQTGRILAMVSLPDFDANQIAQHWDELAAEEESALLLNRVMQGIYPPGSTFKIITALEYIRENNLDIASYSFNCTGHFTANGERINCYHGIAHGQEDFAYSFAKSCNSSFANIGLSLDERRFSTTLDGLLFGQDLPAPLLSNRSIVGLNASTTAAELMQITIGQGNTQMTPYHLNLITAAIANNGVLQQPYLIDSIISESGQVLFRHEETTVGTLMSVGEARVLQELMESVVEYGTATRLDSPNYTAAGKTGSAEYGTTKGSSHAWFTGYAPADDPQICVTIIIEGAGSGGEFAVPVAREFVDVYFR